MPQRTGEIMQAQPLAAWWRRRRSVALTDSFSGNMS
jgi:hypothetical protein